jgi:hypothetical protein
VAGYYGGDADLMIGFYGGNADLMIGYYGGDADLMIGYYGGLLRPGGGEAEEGGVVVEVFGGSD